jgi:hypothetical protein
MYSLTVRVCRVGFFNRGDVKRCQTFDQSVKSVGYAKQRFHYVFKRQRFANCSLSDDGVLIVNYWGPMSERRVKNIIVFGINTDPTAGLGFIERNAAMI